MSTPGGLTAVSAGAYLRQMDPARALLDRVGSDWLRQTADRLASPGGPAAVATAFAAAPRQVGRSTLPAGADLAGPGDVVSTIAWPVDDAARAALLLTIASFHPAALEAVVRDLYRNGDSAEKRAIVRALALLPDGARFVELALDAGRTNESDLFAALACDNPYPARHYGDAEWNKLVMKAVFVGAPLARVVGLDRRLNPELGRMALDYVDQQESAGRAFPSDLWRLVAPFASTGDLARLASRAERAALKLKLEGIDGATS